jgi:hypothetical protein
MLFLNRQSKNWLLKFEITVIRNYVSKLHFSNERNLKEKDNIYEIGKWNLYKELQPCTVQSFVYFEKMLVLQLSIWLFPFTEARFFLLIQYFWKVSLVFGCVNFRPPYFFDVSKGKSEKFRWKQIIADKWKCVAFYNSNVTLFTLLRFKVHFLKNNNLHFIWIVTVVSCWGDTPIGSEAFLNIF